jgi:hypothetical protein
MLRKRLVDKIDLEPVGDCRERGYKFRGILAIDRLIAGEVPLRTAVVAPTGFGHPVCALPVTTRVLRPSEPDAMGRE